MDFEKSNFMGCKPDIQAIWLKYFANREKQDMIKVDEFLNGLVQISRENWAQENSFDQ